MSTDEFGVLDVFVTEARDLVQDVEEGFLRLEGSSAGSETVNALFRAVHTLKGSSGMFGLGHIVEFTHVLETLLDLVRRGELAVTPELVSALLPCGDHILNLVEGVAQGRVHATSEEQSTGAMLLSRLEPFLPGGAGAPAAVASPGVADLAEEEMDDERSWHLSLRFGADSLRNGMDPLAFLRYLATVGTVTELVVRAETLPPLGELDPETCYLGFDVDYVTTVPKADIESIFEFVRDDSDIRITPASDQVDAYVKLIGTLPESDRIGDILIRSGAATEREITDAMRVQQERSRSTNAVVPLGEILIEQNIVPRAVIDAALRKQRKAGETRAQQDTQTLRVDAARLDRLIDLVGELVIAQASAGVVCMTDSSEGSGVAEAQSEVMRLVEEVRDSALSLRMVPIGTTFRRFERVVRDVSVELNKEVGLVVTGGDAEVDKALVERIGDPLVHLVRNSLDHGIEPPADRLRRGKPARGTLRLNAFHDAGSIVIEVADDGRGLDRDKIVQRAVERGLIEPGAVLTDAEAYELIFEPGFSTAATVSNLSGRGVGMDVVRRNVTALRGTIEVVTALGVGTTMRIRLPLTLAIIEGFLVGVGSRYFIVPLDRVTECVELPVGAVAPEGARRDVMDLRGEVLPFIRLRTMFGIDGQPARRQSVVVVEQSGQRTGLVVDALMGEFQTVIKPLGPLFARAKCISGATILGNGEVALILDVGPLVAGQTERERVLHADATAVA
ncbi:chemotaxis protein CheA [Cryptosporangium aurantiacum]|uniref:Chemotaxis protein CheA n=1 Tax=Cryptosporangium aurantiacum TaxID=134849 RepID=A0A1M7RH35_9ACTN|nr:chemotaxis protein CheA [Cryptosporangium aurantiacum]SHN45358.1 two-component system, chemotaxis family, sensor kinase CheA [Cryptosporangium aurantiacum]